MASIRGTVVERPNGTYTAVTAPVPAANGRKKRFSLGTFESREEALRRLVEYNAEPESARASSRLSIESMRLDEYLGQWSRRLERAHDAGELARRTVDDYQASVRLYLVPELGSVRVRDLDREALDAFKARLRDRGLSDRTVLKAWRALHKALVDARLGWNPCALTQPPRVRSSREVVRPTPSEVLEFLEHTSGCDRVGGSPLYSLWRLAATTGLRRGELCALSWDDLDMEAETLTVRHSLGTSRGSVFVKEPKSRAGRRVVGLDRETMETLLTRRLPNAHQVLGLDLVFRQGQADPLRPDTVTKAFEAEWKHSGGRTGVTLHSLRHAHGSALLAAGLPVTQVAAHLGHDPHVLLSIYARELSTTERIEAVSSVAASIYQRK